MSKVDTSITVPVSFLRTLFNLTDQRIAQLAEQGIIVKVARGRYDAWKSVEGYIRFLQSRRSIDSISAAPDTYEAHRARLYKGRADITETQAAAIKGEFHHGQCISDVMNDAIASARARLLALPTIAAPRLADISEVNECVAVLTSLIYEALNELTKYDGRAVIARYRKQQIEPEQETDENDDR